MLNIYISQKKKTQSLKYYLIMFVAIWSAGLKYAVNTWKTLYHFKLIVNHEKNY